MATFIGPGNSWNTASNWDTNSVPTSTDPAIFDNNSPNCTISTTAANCQSIDFTGYTGSFVINALLTVWGNVTLDTTINGVTGSNHLRIKGTSTITSNGYTWPIDMEFANVNTTDTKTLSGDLTVGVYATSGTLTIGGWTNLITSGGGEKLVIKHGLTMSASLTSSAVYGSGTGSKVVIQGGNLTVSGSGGYLNIDTDLNVTNSNIFVGDGVTFGGQAGGSFISGATLKYIAGGGHTCNWATGGTLKLNVNVDLNLDLSGTTPVNIECQAEGNTVTLLSDCTISGNYTEKATYSTKTWNGYNLNIGGNLNLNSITSGAVAGTTVFIMNGTGTWSMSAVTTGAMKCSLTFAGTITISGTVKYNTVTLKWSSGTVITTSSTLECSGSTTFDTNGSSGIDFNNVTMKHSGTDTKTMTSQMYIGGVFTLDTSAGNITFAGTGGILTH